MQKLNFKKNKIVIKNYFFMVNNSSLNYITNGLIKFG